MNKPNRNYKHTKNRKKFIIPVLILSFLFTIFMGCISTGRYDDHRGLLSTSMYPEWVEALSPEISYFAIYYYSESTDSIELSVNQHYVNEDNFDCYLDLIFI